MVSSWFVSFIHADAFADLTDSFMLDCPTDSDPTETCLGFNATIALSVLNETGLDQAAFTEKFQSAINAKLESGWLAENFNIVDDDVNWGKDSYRERMSVSGRAHESTE